MIALALLLFALQTVPGPGPGAFAPASAPSSSPAFVTSNYASPCNGATPACSLTLSGVPSGATVVVFAYGGTTTMTGTLGETFVQRQTGTYNVWVGVTASSGTDTITNNGGYGNMGAMVYSSATGYDNGGANSASSAGPVTVAIPGTSGDVAAVMVAATLTGYPGFVGACGSTTNRSPSGYTSATGNSLWDSTMSSSSYSLSCALPYSEQWYVVGVSVK